MFCKCQRLYPLISFLSDLVSPLPSLIMKWLKKFVLIPVLILLSSSIFIKEGSSLDDDDNEDHDDFCEWNSNQFWNLKSCLAGSGVGNPLLTQCYGTSSDWNVIRDKTCHSSTDKPDFSCLLQADSSKKLHVSSCIAKQSSSSSRSKTLSKRSNMVTPKTSPVFGVASLQPSQSSSLQSSPLRVQAAYQTPSPVGHYNVQQNYQTTPRVVSSYSWTDRPDLNRQPLTTLRRTINSPSSFPSTTYGHDNRQPQTPVGSPLTSQQGYQRNLETTHAISSGQSPSMTSPGLVRPSSSFLPRNPSSMRGSQSMTQSMGSLQQAGLQGTSGSG